MIPPFARWIPVLGLAAVSVACSPKSEISKDVEQSLHLNKTAPTKMEWDLSGAAPEALFEKWRAEKADPQSLCEAFEKVPAQDLTLFENEIESDANAELLGPCQAALKEKLQVYWAELKLSEETVPAQASFRFQDVVVSRDTSRGYKVVTGDLANKQVLLTFDDGPHATHTYTVMNALGSVNAKGLFFVLGRSVKARPGVLKDIAARGHSVGSHSVTHPCLPATRQCAGSNGRMLSAAEAQREIIGGHRAIVDVLGWVDPFFRFPYGASSPALSQFLRDRGVAEFFWSVDSNDWRSSQTPSSIVRNVMRDLNARGRGVLLFHDIHRRTAEAMPSLMRELYFGGYSVVVMKSSDPNARTRSRMLQ